MARQNLASMSVDTLLKLRADISAVLNHKATELKAQLAQMSGSENGSMKGQKSLKGRKVAPKYRSKKDPSLTWAGRGATPVWMREEMKTRKLKKDAFLIK